MTAVGYLRGDRAEVIVCRGSALSYPRHNHVSTLTVGLVLEGAVELATDRGTELCRENGLFALPPYVPHSLKAGAPYTLVSLCVSKELAARGGPGEAREAAAVLLRRALGRPEVEQRLLEGLSILSGGRDRREGPLASLRTRLEAEPELPCSLEDMAASACMSKYHLVRAFRREAGLTPHQFQLQNRVRKGQRLLAGPATVAEAAAAAGFCDQSHFDRHFKRLVGLTPVDYKRCCGALPSLKAGPG